MQLRHVMLGFLSWEPMTGYELKKLFSDSDFLPWSGNNNQIYKTLVSLDRQGLVKKEVIHQESLPSKKRYSITEEGMAQLREALAGTPDSPEVKKLFLMQLAWGDYLGEEELLSLLNQYQEEIEGRLAMVTENYNRKTVHQSRTRREAFLWDMIWQNQIMTYQNELNWLVKLRNGLAKK